MSEPDETPELSEDDERSEDEAEEEGPVDQLGIPMSREPTIDDVRGDGEAHRRFAVGCSLAVMLLIAAFWIVRVAWLGAD